MKPEWLARIWCQNACLAHVWPVCLVIAEASLLVQIAIMKPERLASIWRQYVAHLARTLQELGAARQAQQAPAALDERVEQLADEACVLLMRVSLSNPSCSRVSLQATSAALDAWQ